MRRRIHVEKRAVQAVLLLMWMLLMLFPTVIMTAGASAAAENNNNSATATPTTTSFIPLLRYSGSYHVNVWLGSSGSTRSPGGAALLSSQSQSLPQRQLWIIDTGSRLTATTCDPCPNCGNKATPIWQHQKSWTLRNLTTCDAECPAVPTPAFFLNCNTTTTSNSQAMSSTHNNNKQKQTESPCYVQQRYTEGSSWTARQVQDLLVLGDAERNHVDWFSQRTLIAYSFGCQHELQGLFQVQYANGILGLEASPHSIVAKMAQQGIITRQAFGLCLAGDGGYLTLEHPAGTATSAADLKGDVGGNNISNPIQLQQQHRRNMKYTPLQSDRLYAVAVTHVYLNDECLSCAKHSRRHSNSDSSTNLALDGFTTGRGTIVDSGTTDTFLPRNLDAVWKRVFNQITNLNWKQLNHPYLYTYEQFRMLPTVRIVLQNNVTLTILPHHYVEGLPTATANDTTNNASYYWTGRKKLSIRIFTNEPQGSVLGMNALQDKWIELDSTNQRMGVADMIACDHTLAGSANAASSS